METRIFTKALNILHIEDDDVESMNLARIFKRLGVKHHLARATNGEAALARLKGQGEIDLILLDMHMPRMNGGEFLAALRDDRELAHIKVCVLTSSDLPQDMAIAAKYNVDSYHVKPFAPDKYNEVILTLLNAWETADWVA